MRIIYARTPEWLETAARIDKLIEAPAFRGLKKNGRVCAGFVRDDGREAFVKRVTIGWWIKGMIERMRGSRAVRALRGAAMLEAHGFAHPYPLMAAEARAAGAVYASYVLSEPLNQAQILSDFTLRDGRNFERRKWISARVAEDIRRLHESGIYTLDMQETNLMLAAEGAKLTLYYVDLEDFRRSRRVRMRRRLRNLVHLDRSIGRFVSRSQRLRFLYNYLGSKPEHDKARRLVRRLIRMGARTEARVVPAEPTSRPDGAEARGSFPGH